MIANRKNGLLTANSGITSAPRCANLAK